MAFMPFFLSLFNLSGSRFFGCLRHLPDSECSRCNFLEKIATAEPARTSTIWFAPKAHPKNSLPDLISNRHIDSNFAFSCWD